MINRFWKNCKSP